ncbi:uncharacterized protein LOC142979844 [Anticarsia gemmatalis]|uniref:uncharacterized protein LOC142979844 n=1 Tax=Anticarsia gemmatalis TaxID=129554 RepID=UPI003F7581A5
MKLLAPIAVIIAAASARQIYTQSVENYANSAELYQSGLEHQQRGLYSDQSQGHEGYEVESHRPEGEKTAKILEYHSENDGHHYKYAYETENGIRAEEQGETLDKGTSAHGAFSYKGDDGQVYSITYTADENGFRPTGDHLPTPPPVPEEILKSLEQNAAEEAAGIFDDGKYREYHEQGHQDLRQFDDGHQSEGYHSSGHGSSGHGAELAYHAHAPVHTGLKLVHHTTGHGGHSGHHATSGHASSSYFSHGHSGASSGHEASLGHGSASSGHVANVGHEASHEEHQSGHESGSGHQYIHHGVHFGHHLDSHEETVGHQSFGQEAKSGHQGLTHGVHLQSGFHASSAPTANSYTYHSPSGFSAPSTHGGISGHSGLSYLPPASHGYHGH